MRMGPIVNCRRIDCAAALPCHALPWLGLSCCHCQRRLGRSPKRERFVSFRLSLVRSLSPRCRRCLSRSRWSQPQSPSQCRLPRQLIQSHSFCIVPFSATDVRRVGETDRTTKTKTNRNINNNNKANPNAQRHKRKRSIICITEVH